MTQQIEPHLRLIVSGLRGTTMWNSTPSSRWVTQLTSVVELRLDWWCLTQVQNIDFDHQYERGRELPRIAGMILDFSVIKKGSEIGYFSGKPVKLRDRDNGRGAENHLLQDSLSQKLWKQV